MKDSWLNPENSDEQNEYLDAIEDEWEHPFFLHGVEVGESFAEYRITSEAKRAYDMGEIELWLELYRPKTLAEWAEWQLQCGDTTEFKKRWAETS